MRIGCPFILLLPLLIEATEPLRWHEAEATRTPTALAYGNEVWFGLFEDGRFSSENGLNWTRRSENVAASRLQFLRDEFYFISSTIFASPNGWLNMRLVGSPFNDVNVYPFAFGNDLFYAAWGDEMKISADAKDWTLIGVPELDASIKLIAAGNGYVLFVTSSGSVYSSSDGESWNSVHLGISFADLKVTAFGFLALEYFRIPSGAFATRLHHSYDGLEWSVAQEKPGHADRILVGPEDAVIWGLDILAVVSPDGGEWRDVLRPGKKVIRDMVYAQGRYFGVLWPTGYISSSPINLPVLRSISKSGNTVILQTDSARNYVVERSDRLGTGWTVVSNIIQNGGALEFPEPPSQNGFFRVKTLP